MGGVKMVYYDNYLISVIHLMDGTRLYNSLFTDVGESFNFYKEITKPFNGLRIMDRHIIRDAKKTFTKGDYIIEEKVISVIPWSAITRIDFDEISKLDKDTLKLLSIEEDEDIDNILGEGHRN